MLWVKPVPGRIRCGHILQYAQDIGWTFVLRHEAERRRGFGASGSPKARAAGASLYFDGLFYQKAREFNPNHSDAPEALIGQLNRLQANTFGNRDFLASLRNQGRFFCAGENRELDLVLIDYDDKGVDCPAQ